LRGKIQVGNGQGEEKRMDEGKRIEWTRRREKNGQGKEKRMDKRRNKTRTERDMKRGKRHTATAGAENGSSYIWTFLITTQ
jgi:hypothetical protein